MLTNASYLPVGEGFCTFWKLGQDKLAKFEVFSHWQISILNQLFS